MSKPLNNDQMIKKANKDVRDLGVIASTILTIEIQELIHRRIEELTQGNRDNINLVAPSAVIKVLETYLNAFDNKIKQL
jgi:hypothetical protein|tara:strand:+ start:227 stop:463 length:237 start_codon:yes stop_codon:yes gene_type:complete